MKCNECNNANICLDHIKLPSLIGCTSGIPDHKVPTNADIIRNMSDEELMEFIVGLNNHCLAGIGKCDCSNEGAAYCEDICKRKTMEWLQSEAE